MLDMYKWLSLFEASVKSKIDESSRSNVERKKSWLMY